MSNLFDPVDEPLAEELVAVLAESNGCRVERIVSTGHASPPGFWYDQHEAEWVAVLRGSATLEFRDGEFVDLHAGEHVFIPARRQHRVVRTATDETTIWLAVFLPASSDA